MDDQMIADSVDTLPSEQNSLSNDVPNSTTTTTTTVTDVQNVLESIARITLAGCGGSIVGLSLEKRLESMRVRTAAGLSAAARRKRAPSVRNSTLLLPSSSMRLPMSWSISCMVFCSIIEASRLTSPSTILLRTMGFYSSDDNDNNNNNTDDSLIGVSWKQRSPPKSYNITVADYTIGGLLAGLAGSLSRKFHLNGSSMLSTRIPSPGRYFGVGAGLGLGLMAGCIQAATDYGISLAEQAQREQQQPQVEK
jgi:hypothetical protein